MSKKGLFGLIIAGAAATAAGVYGLTKKKSSEDYTEVDGYDYDETEEEEVAAETEEVTE